MAKAKSKKRREVEEVLDETAVDELEDLAEDLEDADDETEEDDEETAVTPKVLAKRLGIDPKRLRAFLRKTYPRTKEDHNTSWFLTEAQVKACEDHFLGDDEDEDSDEG